MGTVMDDEMMTDREREFFDLKTTLKKFERDYHDARDTYNDFKAHLMTEFPDLMRMED